DPANFVQFRSKIKAIADSSLTSVVFTPNAGENFAGFSFRARDLAPDETIFVTVQDRLGHSPETFSFNVADASQATGRIGVISNLRGDAIDWVKVSNPDGFMKLKLEEFLPASGVPEPGTWAMMTLGIGALGWRMRRRRTLAEVPA
ncbi:MAG: PEP-CTERM sorting domain-containing protein, partial [Caulobacteraceae bacterium]